MSNCWQEKSVQLRFLLGELRLGAVNLRGVVLNHGLHPRPEFFVPDLPPSVDVAVIRSHPLLLTVPQYSGVTAAFRYIPDRYYRCYVDLRQTLPDYLKKFSSKSRYTLRRKVRRFTALSNCRSDVRVFARPDEMEEFHVLARQISAKTYQERLLHAGIPDDPTFVAEMRSLAERDAVRAYTLFLHDHPVAYMYCAAMGENDLMYRFVGHDPEYGHLSPGVVLQYFALENLFAEQRFDCLDFGEGTGMHKQFFSTGSLACADVLLFSRHGAASRHRGPACAAAPHLPHRGGCLRSRGDQAQTEKITTRGPVIDGALVGKKNTHAGRALPPDRHRPWRQTPGHRRAQKNRLETLAGK